MKKTLLFLTILALTGWSVNAQISIPNGDFETWNNTSFDNLQDYRTSNMEAFYNCNASANCVKTADASSGSWALHLTTIGSGVGPCFGYIVNGNPEDDPQFWHGGIAYDQKPTGIQGFYKSDIPVGDSALILVNFSLDGNNIGLYMFKLGGTTTTYTPFSFTFNPPLQATPDSVIFGATSSDVFSGTPITGSTLLLDNISFTGVTSQPALLNGDFEDWTTLTLYNPAQWYLNFGDVSAIKMTDDKHSGANAIELTTTLGNDNGPVARNATISTGYWECDNNDNCYQMGGFPYDKQVDALSFWYKYAPMPNDEAEVNITFKKDGNQFDWAGIRLSASSEYKYVEIPFNLWQAPDTVIVDFQSSLWTNRTVNYIGSVLKVDDVVFKSQQSTVGLTSRMTDEKISVFPNPCTGIFSVKSSLKNSTIEVMNLLGGKVRSVQISDENAVIDLSDQPKGIYFYQIKSNHEIIKQGKIVIN